MSDVVLTDSIAAVGGRVMIGFKEKRKVPIYLLLWYLMPEPRRVQRDFRVDEPGE